MILLEIDRNDPLSVLDIGKVADVVVVVMSCSETNTQGLKLNPDENSNAIDQ